MSARAVADDPHLRLLDLLAARSGLVCVVGAGGKKSTLYRLAEAHLAIGSTRIGLTCSVTMGRPPAELAGETLVAAPEVLADDVYRAAPAHRLLAYAVPSPKPGRIGGVDTDVLATLHARCGFDVTLVKADGARMRWIKAPSDREPVLPPGVTTVLALASAKVIGRPLDATIAHRLERVAAVTGAAPGERLTPAHVGRLLASEDGALRGVGDATVVPVINMVDDAAGLDAARAAARYALAHTRRFDRVVLASMLAPDPIIDLVVR